MAKKKHKLRADFRKNRTVRARQKDLTRHFDSDDKSVDDLETHQRVTGKGELSRKRTIAGAEFAEDASGTIVLPAVDKKVCLRGRVLRVQGLVSVVLQDDGTTRQCATRRLLKTLHTDQRNVVAAGDIVWVRPEGESEGIIERVEPRRGVLCRTSRQRQHIIVTNVDQFLIVASAAEPRLKPNLIDRYLVTAERAEIESIICINKVDLVDLADLQPLVGVYTQLGYRVLLLSATKRWGIESLRELLQSRETAVTGQSGVGKSSLLNALEPGLELPVQSVSGDTEKGRHTTTTAELIRLETTDRRREVADPASPAPNLQTHATYVVDTPGIRQFQLWDVIPEEVDCFFRDLRPYVSHCRYPDCTHTHEEPCAVKDAVADGYIDVRRYESYLKLHSGDEV